MKSMWCWRCKMDLPMLDEDEWRRVEPLLSADIERTKTAALPLVRERKGSDALEPRPPFALLDAVRSAVQEPLIIDGVDVHVLALAVVPGDAHALALVRAKELGNFRRRHRGASNYR